MIKAKKREHSYLHGKHGSTPFRERELINEIAKSGENGLSPQLMYRDGQGIFGKNKLYLHRCLKKLELEKKIYRDEKSYKNVIYKIRMTDEDLRNYLVGAYAQMDTAFEEALAIYRNSASLSDGEAKNLYRGLIYSELYRFLDGIQILLGAEEQWKGEAKEAISKYSIEGFALQLFECWKANPKMIQNVLRSITKELEEKRDNALGIKRRPC
jgi:hypothetical protein